MNKEDLVKLAEKVKDGSATEQEKLDFFKELNKVLADIKNTLEEAK